MGPACLPAHAAFWSKNPMEMIVILKLVAIVFLIVGNAFFVGTEIALTSARRSNIQHLADSGNKRAKVVQSLHAEPERFYSVTQIGITLMSLALGAIGVVTITTVSEPAIDYTATHLSSIIPPGSAHRLAHTTAQVFAFIFISTLHIVGGELAPKVYAFHKPEILSLAVARPVQVIHWILFPFIWFLNHAANGLLRLFGQKDLTGPGGGHFSISEEELRTILVSSETHGVLNATKSAMLRGVFDMEERLAREIMVPRLRIIGIPKEATLNDAMNVFRQERHHRYPVYDKTIDRIIGVLSIKELLNNVNFDALPEESNTTVADIMLPVLIIPGTNSLAAVLQEFKTNRQQMALLIDEYGGTIGMITLEDILEEIVGEYEDEYSPQRMVQPEGIGGRFMINAQSPLTDLRNHIDLEIPPGDYTTLAGFVLDRLSRFPDVGDEIEIAGYKLKVEALDRHRITRVSAQPLPPEKPVNFDDPSASAQE
jgi:CBS domain containing-hemolysin-like protein